MKFSAALILAVLPLLAAAAPAAQNAQKKGSKGVAAKGAAGAAKGAAAAKAGAAAAAKGGKAAAAAAAAAAAKGAKGGKGAAAAKGAAAGAAAGTALKGTGAAGGAKSASLADAGAAANATAADAAGAGAAAAANATAATATGDLQTSLTLDPSVIATGFALDGQQTPVAGQVASKTSTNNFINFCATVPQLPITNGQQVKTGSCNPAPMGIIAASTNMPSCKFVFPANGDTSLQPFQQFTVKLAIKHLTAGNFVNAQASYFAAPQTVDGNGDIIGHSHVVIEAIDALNSTTPTDPTKFAFFKGIDTGADANGQLTVNVAAGLPAGVYKMSTINSASNHQPVLVAIAQHGSVDDAVYFTVGAGGADSVTEDNEAQGGAQAIAAAASAASVAAAAAATPAAAAAGAAAGAAVPAASGAALIAKGGKAAKTAAPKAAATAKAAAAKGAKAPAAAKSGKFAGFKGAKQGGKRFTREY